MSSPRLSIIAALSEKTRAIGINNGLLWKIPEDLKRFRFLTMGHPIIMGRKTYESIGKALPGRTNIVISKNSSLNASNCIIVDSLDKAIKEAKKIEKQEIFIIGGGSIFAQSIKIVDRLYLTLVQSSDKGDIFFPDYSKFTKFISSEIHQTDKYYYEYITLEK